MRLGTSSPAISATIPIDPSKFAFADGIAAAKAEVRFRSCELRAEPSPEIHGVYFTGLAAVFNSLSEDLGGWREIVRPGAFKRTLAAGGAVRHLINHDAKYLLGNTSSGTTTIWEDKDGLRFRTLRGDHSYSHDLVNTIERGDASQCSFAFRVHGKDGQKWSKMQDGTDLRELLDVDLFEISILTCDPAYPKASVGISTRGISVLFPEGLPPEIEVRAKLEPSAENKAIPSHSTATSDKSWDKAANEARLPSPVPLAKAKAAYAWYDESKVKED